MLMIHTVVYKEAKYCCFCRCGIEKLKQVFIKVTTHKYITSFYTLFNSFQIMIKLRNLLFVEELNLKVRDYSKSTNNLYMLDFMKHSLSKKNNNK